MRFIKLFLISIVVLFLLITAFSSLLPSKFRISRAIDIHDSAKDVLLKIDDMKQWDQWNEYVKSLPGKSVTSASFQSDKLTVTIDSSNSASVSTAWKQQDKKAFPGIFNVVPGKEFTTVQWYFEFSIKWYPWEKFGSIIYDKEIGPEMEKSLLNLKTLLEKAS